MTHFERSRTPLILDGVLSQGMVSLVGGAFLAAFALALGAGAFQIGLLAALPAAGQLFQVPAVALLRRAGRRKGVAIAAAALSRVLWLAVAAVPFLLTGPPAFGTVALLVFLSAGFGSVGGVAWLSWMRDLVPEEVMGRFFSTRLMLANVLAVVLSVAGGFFVDWWGRTGRLPVLGYSVIFAVGAALGLLGTIFLARADETPPPAPAEPPDRTSVLEQIRTPFGDDNFRRLIIFSAAWTFAITFAGPFYVVYMLERIGLTLWAVIALTVVSQVFSIMFLGFWGGIADRFSNTSVLAAAGTILLLAILGWTFTTLPEPHVLTVPLLVVLHALMGLAMGGIVLATGTVGLKLSPRGRAEGYVTSLGVVNSLVATAAPLVAGALASFFADKELGAVVTFGSAGEVSQVPALSFRGLDFLFVLTFLLGLYAMHRLAFVQEEGAVKERVVFEELREQIMESTRALASFGGLRQVVWFRGDPRRKKSRG